MPDRSTQFILWFDEIGIEDVGLVGGKNASLGEMYRLLTSKGVRIPNGFAITAAAYRYILQHAGIEDEIKRALKGLDTHDVEDLARRGHRVRELIRNADIPVDLRAQIIAAYNKLSREYKSEEVDVAVRSSATAEDLPDASFAGQQETYLNVHGETALIESVKDCFASLFTNRAISYRVDKKFDHFKVALSIGVQKMVRSDLATSGVMFTVDTETGFKDVVFVTGIYGLGENIVQGAVNPDEYFVFKPTLKAGFKPIVKKVLGEKSMRMVYSMEGNKATKNVPVAKEDQQKFCLSDDEVLKLAEWGMIVEDHYTEVKGKWTPMDLEWAKDGKLNQLFIVQARPETVQSRNRHDVIESQQLLQKGKVLAQGKSVGDKIGQGPAHVITDVKDIARFKEGEVLITEMTDPDWEPIMKKASAIVTNRGGRTCFAGDTKVLTNRGFRTMMQIHEDYEHLLVPSLNRETLKLEWKPIIAVMKRRAPLIEISTSLTGRQAMNRLRLTPDHKMIGIEKRNIVDREIGEMMQKGDHLVIAQRVPGIGESTSTEQRFAYLLGALSTDGHISLTSRHGEVTFVQKPTPEKEAFIGEVISVMRATFGKNALVRPKPLSTGMIRGVPANGTANSYRWFGKLMASELLLEREGLVETL